MAAAASHPSSGKSELKHACFVSVQGTLRMHLDEWTAGGGGGGISLGCGPSAAPRYWSAEG